MQKPTGADAGNFTEKYLPQWQKLLERASNSKDVVDWSTGSDATRLHLAYIDGKYLAVQFYKSGDRAGELATAFTPNKDQLRAIRHLLGK